MNVKIVVHVINVAIARIVLIVKIVKIVKIVLIASIVRDVKIWLKKAIKNAKKRKLFINLFYQFSNLKIIILYYFINGPIT